MLISFVIPTRNRSQTLEYTLKQLEMLESADLGGDSELIVIDNASDDPDDLPSSLSDSMKIRHVRLDANMGAGARNIGVEHAKGEWIIMLDDDSNLMPGNVSSYLDQVDNSYAAIGGEILLPTGKHEAGGLPEVIVGCGCMFRRNAFLEVGGYDTTFGYYAEEYDLCAKLIGAGYQIKHTNAVRFEHRKSQVGRRMDEILFRLVRNNGWVFDRYAPLDVRDQAIKEMVARYEQIAIVENAIEGFERGLRSLEETRQEQKCSSLSRSQWDRFVGDHAMNQFLVPTLNQYEPTKVSVVGAIRGKGLSQIERVIESCGHELAVDDHNTLANVQVVGSLSPGPMSDTMLDYPNAISPWQIEANPVLGAV